MAELENRRRRIIDGYEAGAIQLGELRKRIGSIDSEIQALQALQSRHEAVEIDEETVEALVDVFSCWRDLRRAEKRRLLEAYRIRVSVDKMGEHKGAVAHVETVTAGCLSNVVLYKKMKRLEIE